MFFKRKNKKITEENIEEIFNMLSCPICGGTMSGHPHYVLHIPDAFTVLTCADCGYFFQAPHYIKDEKEFKKAVNEWNDFVSTWPKKQVENWSVNPFVYVDAFNAMAEHKIDGFVSVSDNSIWFDHFLFKWSLGENLEVKVYMTYDSVPSNFNNDENVLHVFNYIMNQREGFDPDDFNRSYLVDGKIKERLNDIFDDILYKYSFIFKEKRLEELRRTNVAKEYKENRIKKFEKILEEQENKNA